MWFLSWLALAAAAAPIAVELPEGEPAGAWTEALALAGLVPSGPDRAPTCWIEAVDGRWRIRVADRDGVDKQLVAAPPRTEEEREALAHLIASVARPVAIPGLPALPEPRRPAPAPAAPVPIAEPVAPEPEAPSRPVAAAPGVAYREGVPDPTVEREPEAVSAWPFEAWARAGGGVSWRDAAGAPHGAFAGGVGWGPARLGVGLSASGPFALGLSGERWSDLSVVAGGSFAIPEGPVLGVAGGISRRRYAGELTVVRSAAVVELGWRVGLSPALDLVPLVQVSIDPGLGGLRRTSLEVDGERVGDLAPTALALQVALSVHGS